MSYQIKSNTRLCLDCGVEFVYRCAKSKRCFDCADKRRIFMKAEYEVLRRNRNRAARKYSEKGTYAQSREVVDRLLGLGIGNTISDKELLDVGYTKEEIPEIRKKFPDTLYIKEEEDNVFSGCGCSLYSGEIVRPTKRSYAM